jgi:imidazole glycerol phosphate synthase glutamine amidotransferase subunit
MKRIALVDVGAGNVFNVALAIERLGPQVDRIDAAADLNGYDAVVFPGVANFGFVCTSLRERGLEAPIHAAIAAGVPFLGICVGMQVLFESSEEAPEIPGLGILRGQVTSVSGPRVPQIGWNAIAWSGGWSDEPGGWVYFANSYAAPADVEDVAAVADYGRPFAAACVRDRIVGFQFHPERSGRYGLSLLERFFVGQAAHVG